MDSEMNKVLAYSDQVMIKGNPEGLLNNFVSDLILKKSNEYYKAADGKKVDMCLLNTGGLRQSLPKGAITLGKVYELMPFENYLVIVTLSGVKTKQMFDYIAKVGGMPLSGFAMGMKDTLAVNVTMNGKPFDISKNYTIVTSDYLANGGDKMKFFNDPIKREALGVKVRDAIIIYIKEENEKGNTLKAKLDKRIYYEK
jgi:2',3'-cyclic-nucleotide 2'-phosphodiesterase (5'-nucleotidase family)